jgi:hypothetical protein
MIFMMMNIFWFGFNFKNDINVNFEGDAVLKLILMIYSDSDITQYVYF